MKKYFCSFLFVFVLLMICPDVLGQNNTSSFDYPFKPGSETWNQYSSTLERVYALQIPDNVIVNLSTDTLLDICLDYPFLIELCLDDNYQKNFDLISSQFNGLSELLNRSDLFEALLNKNSILMNRAPEMKACESVDRVSFAFKCFVVELLLVQDAIADNYGNKSQLAEILMKNQIVRRQNKSIFWKINDIPSKIFQSKNVMSPFRLMTDDGHYVSASITTPNLTSVSDTWTWVGEDLTSSDPEFITGMQLFSQHSNDSLVSYPSLKYNCHGYAWHVSEGGSKVWIGRYDTEAEDVYWLDGSYIQVPEEIGDKVSYYGNHSAIRISSSLYESKWGSGVLARHAPNDVPSIYLSGSTVKTYYVKKPYTVFVGPSLINNTDTFTIVDLENGYTVEWSLSDSYYDNNCIQKNYPSENQCVITASASQQMQNATLSATIKKNGYVVTTLTKTVSAYSGFYGTYYNGQTTKQINLPNPLYVLPNTFVTINSPMLVGATLSYQGNAVPSPWMPDTVNGSIRFGMPSNIGATLLITVISNGVTYYLPVIVASVVHGFYVTSNDGQIHISLIPEDNNIMTLEENPLGTAYGKSYWILDIYNVTNGEKVYHQIISDFSCDINTLSWKKGLYALHIEIGDTVYNEKILVK